MTVNALRFEFVAVRKDGGGREAMVVKIEAPLINERGAFESLVTLEGCGDWSIKAYGVHAFQCIENAIAVAKVGLRAREDTWRFEDADGNEMPFSYEG